MTLPATPPITLGQVCTEFGAPATTALGAFLRNGAWVQNIPQNASVPIALPISLGQLCGASSYNPMSGASATGLTESVSHTVSNYTTTGSATATVSGGNPSKTYTWVYLSGTNFTVISQGSVSTKFQQAGAPAAGLYTGTYKCTITDGTGSIDTNNITISINRT